MRIVLALFLGLLVALGSHAQKPESSTASSWKPAGSRSYEESHPGLGTSWHFSSSYGWIDVFTYGLKRNDWVAGTCDPQFAEEFSGTLGNVVQAAAQGITSDLKMGPAREVTLGGQPFRTASFSFVLRGQPSDSAVYLTAKSGQLLKYRITVKADSNPRVTQLAEEFIARDLPSRLGTP